MKTAMNSDVKTYSVPLDMLMDILSILFDNGIPNRIKGINVKDNILWLDVKLPPGHPYRKEIQDNINTLLRDYEYYLNGTVDADFSEGNTDSF